MDGDRTVTNAPMRSLGLVCIAFAFDPVYQAAWEAGRSCWIRFQKNGRKILLMFLSQNYLVYILNAVLHQEWLQMCIH